jgi:hypothetical protein
MWLERAFVQGLKAFFGWRTIRIGDEARPAPVAKHQCDIRTVFDAGREPRLLAA